MKRESWLPATPESVPIGRAFVREVAVEHHLDEEATWDLMLAATEAISNAVLHGTPCGAGDRGVLVSVEPLEQGFYVEVSDCGEFEAELRPAPYEATHGRGLPILAAVVDDLELVPDPYRTRVRFGKRRVLAAAGQRRDPARRFRSG
jgi:anti-sigma regulatory factor (Ser/Thr protein kinase)